MSDVPETILSLEDKHLSLKDLLEKIFDVQLSFQMAAALPITSTNIVDKLKLSEMYIHKAIEELVELRKEAPSFMNRYEKNPGKLDLQNMQKELADVFLFLVNYFILWGFDLEEFLKIVRKVQQNNVDILGQKILKDQGGI